MGRKKKIIFDKVSSEFSSDATIPTSEIPSTPMPRRISVLLNDDGSVAFGSMRDDQISDFKKLIHRPEIVEEITPKPATFISPQACDGLFDVLGKIASFTATKFKDIPVDIADQAFLFTPQEKEILRDPTARVINKYAPTWMVKYQDEIALTLMVVTIVNAKIILCNSLIAARIADTVIRQTETPAATQSAAVTPINGEIGKPVTLQ